MIDCEEGYNYGKKFVIDTVDILSCYLPKGRPHLFWICSNYKACFLNLEDEQFPLCCRLEMLWQYKSILSFSTMENFSLRAFLPLHNQIVGDMTVQYTSIFGGIITKPTLRNIRLEVGNYEFIFKPDIRNFR